MCVNKIVVILKIIEQNRFLMVGLDNLLSALQQSEVISLNHLDEQMNTVDQINWVLALTLRISLMGNQWCSLTNRARILNSMWLVYFFLKGVLLQVDMNNASWMLNGMNQILLCGDLLDSENIQQAFHLILYALGYFSYIDFFQCFPQGILTGSIFCHVMMHGEKLRNHSQADCWYLLYQCGNLIGLPLLMIYVFQNCSVWELGVYWLSCILIMSCIEYGFKKNTSEVEVAPQPQLSPV